jgi:hypothetical protein
MIKEKKIYIATDQYDGEEYYNIFFKIGERMEYLSIEPITMNIEYIIESYDDFQENVLGNYLFEEYDLDIEDKREIVIKVVRNEI